MACMLWEDTFYVDGKTASEQIEDVCKHLDQIQVLNLAREIHLKGLLRHVPLFLIVCSFKCRNKMKSGKFQGKSLENVKHYISEICSRPDQMTELLSLYWKNDKTPIAAQLKKGLAHAFRKFDEYQIAKYNRGATIKLRDVLFLCHSKPTDKEHEALYKKLVDNQLKSPDTWEVRLSSGRDKKESFTDLLQNKKLGKLALIRNLRNMFESGVSKELVKKSLEENTRPLLPFQFLAAAKMVPQWEDIIDASMIQSMDYKQKLHGKTIVLVDVSGSMEDKISSKSQMSRMDAACGFAILLREVCENPTFFTFSDALALVPPRTGMALRDAIIRSQPHSSTYLGNALRAVNKPENRIIVITDEQAHDVPPKMVIDKCYMMNVGTFENGIKNLGQWHTITGFSENCIDYILELESQEVDR